MFEQESYSFEVPAEPIRQGDLFYKYEVGRWQLNNRIYAILAIAAVINFTFFGVLAQTNILTARGCDSPFVGRVCQVLDMAYVGAMLYGTDREYVDAAYDKIDINDAEVVWIDQTGVPAQLEYPEGYFQLANPEQFAQQQAMLNNAYPTTDGFSTSGFPPISPPIQSGSSLIDTPAIAPKNNPKARPNNLPDSPFDLSDVNGDSSADANNNKGKTNVNSNKKPDENQTANTNSQKPETPKSESLDAIEINKRPIADLGNSVNDLVSKNELDLLTPFIGSAKGKLNKDGRIDSKTLKLQIESPDADMQKIVQDGILAIDAAGYLKYLSAISGRDFDLLLKQDETNISATVQSEMESETRAKTIKSSLDLALSIAKAKKQGAEADQNDKDDLTLLQGAKIEVVGKRVVITFIVPKEVAHPMIQRKLAEQAAEVKKPSGNAMTPQSSNTAAKY
jgi:hypothetical protein